MPYEQQKDLYPDYDNAFNELLITWHNSYQFIVATKPYREPVSLTKEQQELIEKLNNSLIYFDSSQFNGSQQLSSEWEKVRKLAKELLISMEWENVLPLRNDIIFYPWMRSELISYLHGLSDETYQYEAWAENNLPDKHPKKYPASFHDEFDYYVHFLYDDTNLATDPNSLIGWILKDTKEAEAITHLIQQLELLFEKYRTKLTDKDYIEKPEWNQVVEAAQNARKIFTL